MSVQNIGEFFLYDPNENISGELDYRGRLIKFIKLEDMEEDEDFLEIFKN
jgi:hypothetical protein